MRVLSMCRAVTAFALALAATSAASGDVLWDESVNGDLSGNGLNPTPLVLSLGTNSIIATSVAGDREYFSMLLGGGLQLNSIFVTQYVGGDPLAFIAVQTGATFTEPFINPNVGNILGWSHFGTGNNTVGSDILDNMGLGLGAIGFTPPLHSNTYTFWSQQTGLIPLTYQLDFIVTPAPSTLLMLAAAGMFSRRRRR